MQHDLVDTLEEGARAALTELPDTAHLRVAIHELLDYAAERLEKHPSARGPMTMHAVKIACILTGRCERCGHPACGGIDCRDATKQL